jgi:hypothetical protein
LYKNSKQENKTHEEDRGKEMIPLYEKAGTEETESRLKNFNAERPNLFIFLRREM